MQPALSRPLRALPVLALLLLPVAALGAPAPKPSEKPKPAAAADPASPTSLGGAKGWNAYVFTEKNAKVCYLVGRPAKSAPAVAGRKNVDVLITHRPAEKAENVVNFDLGYAAKPDSKAELEIDGKKFTLFTNKDSAWNSDAAADKAVTDALAKGKHATLKSVPPKGATVTDSYSLDGFATALALIDKACAVKR